MTEKAVLYCRVSTQRQFDTGVSIDEQISYLRDYAKRSGLTVVQEFITHESAAKAGRKIFNEMITTVKKAKIKHIVVELTDRLIRNMHDYVLIEDLIKIHGIWIHRAKEGLPLHKDSNNNDLFLFGIKALMAKNFIDNHSQRVRDCMITAASQGKNIFPVPMGYKIDKNTKQVIIDDLKAFTVKKVFADYLRNVPIASICKENKLGRTTVFNTLKNPFYIGKLRAFGELWPQNHTPIIPEEIYYAAQKKMELSRTNKKRTVKKFNFSGLINCSCGRVMVGEEKTNRHGKTYVYYRCSSKFETQKCKNTKYLSEREILEYFFTALDELQFEKETLRILMDNVKQFIKQQTDMNRAELSHIRAHLSRIDTQIENTDDLLTDGTITPAKYKELNIKYQALRKDLLSRQTALMEANTESNMSAYNFIVMVANYKTVFLNIDNRVAFCQLGGQITRNLFWDGENLIHTWSDIIISILNINKNCRMVNHPGHYAQFIKLWKSFTDLFNKCQNSA